MFDQIKLFVEKLKAKRQRHDYIVNAIKEWLQIRVLDFIYNHKQYSQKLVFTGGTCLRFCFGLPRLSEDLDFDFENTLDTTALKQDLVSFLVKNLKLNKTTAVIKGQTHKIYLKFPILQELGLSFGGSRVLFLKIEPMKTVFSGEPLELTLINREGLYFFLKRYSLPDLMSGKIAAFLNRSFFKGKSNEIDFKGRDVFDLVWYMGKNIRPNEQRLRFLLQESAYQELPLTKIMEEVRDKIIKLSPRHLSTDLTQFIEDRKILEQFLSNYKTVLEQYSKDLK